MAKRGPNISSWRSVVSFAQLKKDLIKSHSEGKLHFWVGFFYIVLPILGACGLIIYRIFQSIFDGNTLLAFTRPLEGFDFVCYRDFLLR